MENIKLATENDFNLIIKKLETIENKLEGRFPKYLSTKQLQEEFGISASTCQRLENSGAITPKRLPGSKKKFFSLEEFIAALENDE